MDAVQPHTIAGGEGMKTLLAIIGIPVLGLFFMLMLLITFRLFVEVRYFPSSSMEPTIQVNDRILVEKVKTFLKSPYRRGEIVLFYPPLIEMGGKDLVNDPSHILGRLTGLPYFAHDFVFAKRVIGLPGDKIVIRENEGVYVNGILLSENYVKEIPQYNLQTMGAIRGRNLNLEQIQYESDPKKATDEIVVPKDQLFVLGDNRNNSEDSHVWGFLPKDRVLGRALTLFRVIERPKFPKLPVSQQAVDELQEP